MGRSPRSVTKSPGRVCETPSVDVLDFSVVCGEGVEERPIESWDRLVSETEARVPVREGKRRSALLSERCNGARASQTGDVYHSVCGWLVASVSGGGLLGQATRLDSGGWVTAVHEFLLLPRAASMAWHGPTFLIFRHF